MIGSDVHTAVGGAQPGASNGRAPSGKVVLRVDGLSKRYGGVAALTDVSMYVRDTEVVALVGDNGAGKSTFAKIVSGIERPDGGLIQFAGKPASLRSPQAAAAAGIQTVYQDLALCDTLDTVQNLFLGRELYKPWYLGFRLARAAMEMRAQDLLSGLGAKIASLSVPVGALSGGQRQAVAICRAVLSDPSLVILDEPTAALGVAQRAEVLALIERLRASGKGVIVISHDMHDILQIADRVVVFRLGRVVAEMHRGQFTQQELVAAIMGASTGTRP